MMKLFRSPREVLNRVAVSPPGEVRRTAEAIVEAVQREGDEAVAEYTRRFDGISLVPPEFEVPRSDWETAASEVERGFLEALRHAREQIEAFARLVAPASRLLTRDDGVVVGCIPVPLDSVGVYVPGGSAPLPSSLLMTAIPARVAGVGNLVVCTPPGPGGAVDPYVAAAALEAGVDRLFRIGGAQAIAALAYGTATVPPVDMIAGPGNRYVNEAKRLVSGHVGIDLTAGPSEVAILADSSANPYWVAADMLSQAEHGPDSSAVLITDSEELARATARSLEAQLEHLGRKEIIRRSLETRGGIVVVADLDHGLELCNELAPEHLELHVDRPWDILGRVKHAGTVFLGGFTPEPVGDYIAGPSHVLPTGGSARYASGLSTASFVKYMNFVCYSRSALDRYGKNAVVLAEAEGLSAHANALKVRGVG